MRNKIKYCRAHYMIKKAIILIIVVVFFATTIEPVLASTEFIYSSKFKNDPIDGRISEVNEIENIWDIMQKYKKQTVKIAVIDSYIIKHSDLQKNVLYDEYYN